MKSSLFAIACLLIAATFVFLYHDGGAPLVDVVPAGSVEPTSTPTSTPDSSDPKEPLVAVDTRAERTLSKGAATSEAQAVTEASPLAETLLIVRVVDPWGVPLVGASVVCNGGSTFFGAGARTLPVRGQLYQTLQTDAAGQCTFEAPLQTPIYVLATPSQEGFRAAQGEHAGLDAGEVAVLEIVAMALDGWLYGVAYAAEDGTPLPGTSVHALDKSAALRFDGEAPTAAGVAKATTDSEGLFQLALTEWGDDLVLLTREGRAPVLLEIDTAFDRPGNAKPARMPLAAGLQGRILGTYDSAKEVSVRLTCPLYHLAQPVTNGVFGAPDPEWTAPLGPDGQFALTGLPPEVPLELSVVQGNEVLLRPPTPLTFAPGESRDVEWDLSSTATLRVVVVDSEGAPQPDVDLGLFPGGEVFGNWIQPRFKSERRALSDESGRVEWKDLRPGHWAIGPVHRPRKRGAEGDPAPVLTRVTIAPEAEDVEVQLTIHRGLTIRGRVLGPEGEIATRAFVFAEGLGASLHVSKGVRSDGTFTLGPLPAGSYRLGVNEFTKNLWCQAERPVVEAGAKDVELQFAVGGSVRVRFLDPVTGERPEGIVWIQPVDGGGLKGLSIAPSAEAVLGGLAPGTYHISGETDTGSVGALRDVQIRSGEELGPLDIALEPAGRIRVYYAGASEHANYLVRQTGVTFSSDGIRSGTSTTAAAPIGTVEVVLTMRAEATASGPTSQVLEHSRTVDVKPGDEAIVEFRLDK